MEIFKQYLIEIQNKHYMVSLKKFLMEEQKSGRTYIPQSQDIFSSLQLCSFEKLKVVILGTEPYCDKGIPNGLAFSTHSSDLTIELKCIFREVWSSFKQRMIERYTKEINLKEINPNAFFQTGDLSQWAQQGVLLLNTSMTVEENMPLSHQKKGWGNFISELITFISTSKEHLVFMLWGEIPKKFRKYIKREECHLILEAGHPSPNSKEWFGKHHFNETDKFLNKHNMLPVIWWLKNENT